MRKLGSTALTVPIFAILLFASYMVLVVFAKTMFDHGIGLQDRMLIPLFPFLLLAVVFIAHRLSIEDQRGKLLAIAIVGYLAIVSVIGSLSTLPTVYEEGLGWNARNIVTSPAIAELKVIASSPENVLFSNETYGMYFHTKRVGYNLNSFPPAETADPVYLVLFKVQRNDPHPLPARYTDELKLIIEDNVLSIYLFIPK
ncbi:MAG: hypothetical protein WD751_11195 [Anaerolineales bacterium]